MPLERITFKTQVWRKLISCARREKNILLKNEMDALKHVTASPKNDAIVWEPPIEFKRQVAIVLTKEQAFMRKPDSALYKFVTNTIKEMKASLPDDAFTEEDFLEEG